MHPTESPNCHDRQYRRATTAEIAEYEAARSAARAEGRTALGVRAHVLETIYNLPIGSLDHIPKNVSLIQEDSQKEPPCSPDANS